MFGAGGINDYYNYAGNLEKGPAYGYRYGYRYGYQHQYYKSKHTGEKEHQANPSVFAYADEVEMRLKAKVKPDGSRKFPSKSCRDLQMCFPDVETGRTQ